MSNNTELEQINLTIEEAEKQIAKMDALDRLRENKDFQLLIENGYFKDEASRLVLLKADPNFQKEEDQIASDKMIIAIGYFRQYLRTIYQLGSIAKRSLDDYRDTRNEIMTEAP